MVAAVVTMIGRSRTTVGDDDVEEEMLTITGPGEANGRKFKKWSPDEEEAITLVHGEFSGQEGCWKDVAAMAVDRTPAAVTEKWKVMQRERKPLASARWYPSGDSKEEMESAMAGGSMPSATEISYLASRFGVPYEKVKIWCQNHTARARRSAGTQAPGRWQLSRGDKATLEEAYGQPESWIRNRQQGMSPTQQVTKRMMETLGVNAASVKRWFASRRKRDATDGRIAVTATGIAGTAFPDTTGDSAV